MHVALLANSAWLDEEAHALRQLVVGLVDEQVRVTRVVPGEATGPSVADSPLLGGKVTWAESRFAALDHRRVVKLAGPLDAAGVDLVHALDVGVWQPAAVIGEQLDIPVLFQVSTGRDLEPAVRLAGQVNPSRCGFVASTGPLGEALREGTEGQLTIEVIRPGVHAERREAEPRNEEHTPSVAVCGDGQMDGAYEALLEGVRGVVAEVPGMQFFLDGRQTDQHQVWKAARRLDLLGNLSFVPRHMGRREVLLMADALVHPQVAGRCRGLTLMAMAHGLPVLAPADPHTDHLIPNQTAWVLDDPTPQAWALLLRRLVHEPDEAAALGERARGWVGHERLASDAIERVIHLYRTISGQPLPYPG